jgi:hypothetical protein
LRPGRAWSTADALAKPLLEPYCEVLHGDADTVAMLDDKYTFSATAASLGLTVPDAYRICDPGQVEDFDFGAAKPPYILKSIPYDPVHRLDLTTLPRPSRAETAAFARSKPISGPLRTAGRRTGSTTRSGGWRRSRPAAAPGSRSFSAARTRSSTGPTRCRS